MGALSTDAILVSQSRKAVPGVCVACHGGKYDSNAHLSNRSNFLPFDTSSFIFDGDGDFSEPNQRESFRKLNSMVKSTAPVQTIRDLIDGWYSCGVDKPGCAPDPEFVPGGDDCPASSSPIFPTCGWSQASVPHYNFDPKKFYLAVPKTYCRTCHVARPESFNVQNFTDFKLGVSSVAASVCKG